MRKTFKSKNNSKKSFGINKGKNNEKELFEKFLILRQNDISDSKFDINEYLDIAKTKYIFNTLDKNEKNFTAKSSDNLTKQNSFGNKSFGKILNMSSDKKPKLNLPNLSMNISKYSISNIYKPKTKYLASNTNYNLNSLKVIKPKNNTSYNKFPSKNNDNFFNVIKTIKSIKLKEKNFDFQSYLKKTKNIIDKKNALIALDSDDVLLNYKKNKKIKETEDIPISTFITQRKEISINNLIIKLINKESNKLQTQEKKMKKDLKKDINYIESEEKKLQEYSNNQKLECKQIETTLAEIITKHENLIKKEQELILDVKVKEFEIYKLLININLYRYFAKFCNTVLDGDPSRFEKQLLPDYHEFDKIDLEPIIEEVIKNYWDIKVDRIPRAEKRHTSILKNHFSAKKVYKIKYKEEGYFLYNPEFLYHKYNEIEGNILRLLTTKEKLIIKKLKREKQSNEALSYLIDRCRDIQNEYDSLYSSYISEKKKYENDLADKGSSDIDMDLIETNKMIKDLYICAIEILEEPLITLCKLNKRNFEKIDYIYNNKIIFDELVKYGKKLLENFEINLNILLKEIRDERKEDVKTFEKVIKGIKIYYKIKRQNVFEKNLENENRLKKLELFDKQNEIKLIPRRNEPPYYKNKVKKVEIDYDAIRKEEDKELINYH